MKRHVFALRLALAVAAGLVLTMPAHSREPEVKKRLTNWVEEGVFICESVCPTIGPVGPACCQVFQI